MPKTAPVPEPEQDTGPREDVPGWRFEQFLSCGMSADAAIGAASSSVDLNDFRVLRSRGCDPDLAYEILR